MTEFICCLGNFLMSVCNLHQVHINDGIFFPAFKVLITSTQWLKGDHSFLTLFFPLFPVKVKAWFVCLVHLWHSTFMSYNGSTCKILRDWFYCSDKHCMFEMLLISLKSFIKLVCDPYLQTGDSLSYSFFHIVPSLWYINWHWNIFILQTWQCLLFSVS